MDGWVNLGALLHDLRSVKLSKSLRTRVDEIREYYQRYGGVPAEMAVEMTGLATRFKKQLSELHAARERARITNGRRAMGISKDEAQKRVQAREDAKKERLDDVGL